MVKNIVNIILANTWNIENNKWYILLCACIFVYIWVNKITMEIEFRKKIEDLRLSEIICKSWCFILSFLCSFLCAPQSSHLTWRGQCNWLTSSTTYFHTDFMEGVMESGTWTYGRFFVWYYLSMTFLASEKKIITFNAISFNISRKN